MFAPFNPDPECPFCSGRGTTSYVVPDYGEVGGRCECTNWSAYAVLRRAKGLTMKQAMDELQDEFRLKDGDDLRACPF